MKKNIKIAIILCLLAGALFFINRDLFEYEQVYVYRRAFKPGVDPKGDYILSDEPMVLKPGKYEITLNGSFRGKTSGYFLIDSSEEKLFTIDFPADDTEIREAFTVTGGAKQVRFGISWDPDTAVTVDRVMIRSDHVLYRSSLMKHAVISGAAIILGGLIFLRSICPETWRRLFPRISKPENERMLLLIIILTIIVSVPFLREDSIIDGDDFYYHMRHLKGIAASLSAGHFPARILLDWVDNYGYGSGFYYPNLFLTFPAVLILCGFHVVNAYEIFVTFCTFFSLLTMFITVRRIGKSEKAAQISVMLYAFAAYRLIDVFYRAALGEIQAFIFLPLIILGFYEIMNGHCERWWIFGIAFTGLLWCHVISLAIAGFFTAVYALFYVRRIFTDRKIFFAFLKAVIFTLGLGTWFLLPMIEQAATNQLKINMIMFSPEDDPYGSITRFRSLFLFFNDWNYSERIRSVYPGWVFFFIPVLRIITLRRKDHPDLKLADGLTAYGFITLVMCTSLFPWKVFIQFLYRIQFAWRIMMISTVLLSVSCSIYTVLFLEKYFSEKSAGFQLVPVFLLCLICGGPIIVEAAAKHVLLMDDYRYVKKSNFLSGSEYMPTELSREYIEKTGDHIVCETEGFETLSFSRKGLSVTFSFLLPNADEDAEMQVPLIYYTGYRAYFTGSDGVSREVPVFRNHIGLAAVSNGKMAEGTIRVQYVKTLLQHLGDSISLLTLGTVIILTIRRKKRKTLPDFPEAFEQISAV